MKKPLLLLATIISSTVAFAQTNHLNGQTKLTNPTGRTLLIEKDDDDSWLTFHDPGNHWFSMGIDRSNSGALSLNSGGSLTSSQFVMLSNGNIGIGTTSPVSILNIDGGTGSLPTGITFGDGNTGFYESADNTLITTIGGTNTFYWAGNLFRAAKTSAPALMNEVASSANPTLVPSNSDQDTGVGWSSTNQLSLITGGSEAVRINSDGDVGIGTTTPSVQLEVYKQTGTEVVAQFRTPEGSINIAAAGNSIGNSTYGNYISSRNSNNTAYKDLGLKTTGGVPQFMIKTNGNVGIGTITPESKLAVDGQIRATEVKVLTDVNSVPDYVFESDYDLRTLKETKEYIAANKHLPEIPSASEIGENGIDLGDMNMRLLKKIEELTLHLIEQSERVEKLEEEVSTLKRK